MKSMKIRGLSLILALILALGMLPFAALADDANGTQAAVGNDASVVVTVKPNKTSCGRGESISAAVSLRNVNGTMTGLTGGFASESFVIILTDGNYNTISGFAVQRAAGLDAACSFTFPKTCSLPSGTYRITARKTVGSNTYFGQAPFYYSSEQTEPTERTEPFIVTQPTNKTAVSGKTVTFKVKADGGSLKYQWYVQKEGKGKWTRISGACKAELSFTAGRSMNGNRYRCVVSCGDASITTDSAKLTVVTVPKISSQPGNACVKAGKTVTFKVKASGGKLKYQWYYQKPGSGKWVEIVNATKASYSLTAKAGKNGYRYRCTVENKAGSVCTRAAKLTVK